MIFDLFYDTIKADYEGARISYQTLDSIVRRWDESKTETLQEQFGGQEGMQVLLRIMQLMVPLGFNPAEGDLAEFIGTVLEDHRTAVSVADQALSIWSPPASMDYPVVEDIVVYTYPGSSWQKARKIAARERNMHGPGSRVFFHEHQPCEPCTGKCKEVEDAD